MPRIILYSTIMVIYLSSISIPLHAQEVLIFQDGTENKEAVQKDWVTAAITVGKIMAQILSQRKERAEIKEIKSYLNDLKVSVEAIAEQNNEIISKIDAFPSVVEEELRKKELERSYRTLVAYRDAFYTWDQRRWTIGGAAGLIAAYRAIGDYEIDPKRIGSLVEWGEFLQHLSRGSLRSVVLEVVVGRQGTLDQLVKDKQDQFAISELIVERTLKSNYLVDVKIEDRIEESSWKPAANRSRPRPVTSSCNCRRVGRCADSRVCDICRSTVDDGDPGFDAQRDKRVSQLNFNILLMKKLRVELVALRTLRDDLLGQYVKVLDYSSDEKELPSDMRIKFFETVPFGEKGFTPLKLNIC